MQSSQFIAPRIGLPAIVMIGLWAVFLIVAELLLAKYLSAIQSPNQWRFVLECLLIGASFGMLTALCWISTCIEHQVYRFLARSILVFGSALLINTITQSPSLLKSSADCLGLVLGQVIVFRVFRVPNWYRKTSNSPSLHKQFSVFDIGVVTLVVALLIAVVQHYEPRIDGAKYWGFLIGLWVVLPLSAVFIVFSAVSTRVLRQIGFLLCGVGLCISGALIMVWAEKNAANVEISRHLLSMYRLYYLSLFVGHCVTIRLSALAGRFGESSSN